MKRVYLVRHAKASWDDNVHDWERPLTEAGVERAQNVAKTLKAKKKVQPDKIISSYAFRALNTAIIFAMHLNYPVTSIEISQNIYEKKAIDMLDLIRKQDDKLNNLMLFGHDPGITELYNLLTKEIMLKLSTSAVACIEFQVNHWKDVGSSKGKTLYLESGK